MFTIVSIMSFVAFFLILVGSSSRSLSHFFVVSLPVFCILEQFLVFFSHDSSIFLKSTGCLLFCRLFLNLCLPDFLQLDSA